MTIALAVHQFTHKFVALQWIFAFVIMAVLFVLSIPIMISFLLGKQAPVVPRGAIVDEERERQPLIPGGNQNSTIFG